MSSDSDSFIVTVAVYSDRVMTVSSDSDSFTVTVYDNGQCLVVVTVS